MSPPSAAGPAGSVSDQIARAADLLRRGELAGAELLLRRLLAQAPGDATVLHLAGVLAFHQGRFDRAAAHLDRSLTIRPGQPVVCFSHGRALQALGRDEEAVGAYRAAAATGFDEAFLSLGDLLCERGDAAEAAQAYGDLLARRSGHVEARLGLAGTLVSLARAGEAEAILRTGLAEAFDARLEQSLAVALHLQGRSEDALASYDKVRRAAPATPDIDHGRARLLDTLGRHDEALAVLGGVLAHEPDNLAAHRDYNHLLYRLRREDEFLRSYDRAAAQSARPEDLLADKAWFLLNAERYEAARGLYGCLAAAQPADPVAAAGLGVALEKLGELEAALEVYRAALARRPDDANLYSNVAAVLLRLGEARDAAAMAEQGLARAPADQMCLASLSLAWRMLGDAREDWLCAYPDLVRTFDLEPPEGFSSMAQFNAELDAMLDRHHPDTREYVNQSLRGGTQTPSDVFGAGHGLVDLLQRRIDQAVARYVAEAPAAIGGGEGEHPFLARRRAGFSYAGSWSSRLHDCGFHANHVHPKGWISSCYYVAVPDVADDAGARQGWLKFGEPSFDLGLADPVRHVVKPQAGRLVLFPSYLWHGTVPFRSASARTTIAFDAVPAATGRPISA